jgi:hypothetical protein
MRDFVKRWSFNGEYSKQHLRRSHAEYGERNNNLRLHSGNSPELPG